MLTSLCCLFAANRTEPFLQKAEDWVGVGLLAGVLLVGAAVVYAVDRWRKRAAAPDRSAEELTDYRAMYDRGEITEAEYARLREKVAGRVKAPPPPAPPAAPGPPPGVPPAGPPA